MSTSSYLFLQYRIISRPKPVRAERWYVPWLATGLALGGVLLAAIAALEILTSPLRVTPASRWPHAEQLMLDDGLDQRGTMYPFEPQVTVK